jgi:hypothetical protein
MPTSTTFMPGGPDSGTGRRPIAIRAWTKLIGIVPELALRKNSALTGWSQTDWQYGQHPLPPRPLVRRGTAAEHVAAERGVEVLAVEDQVGEPCRPC